MIDGQAQAFLLRQTVLGEELTPDVVVLLSGRDLGAHLGPVADSLADRYGDVVGRLGLNCSLPGGCTAAHSALKIGVRVRR